MGKNKRKRSLNISSGSSNLGDTSLSKNSPQTEKSNLHHKSETRKNNQNILSTAYEDTSLTVDLTKTAENMTGDEYLTENNKNTKENYSDGNARKVSLSNDNRRGPGVTTSFESYFETLTKRRSQSLENRPNQMQLKKEDFLKVDTPQNLQDQRHTMDGKEGKIHKLTHPKKKIKMSMYTDKLSD